jgi:hypothetical protein
MNIIIPAAGRSTRFPDMKPKWLLTHPNGNLMVTESIRGLNLSAADKIHLVILKEHLGKFCSLPGIKQAFSRIGITDKLRICVLAEPTRHQPETVAYAIAKNRIKGSIFIKDSDNFFQCRLKPGNSVAVADLADLKLVNAANKSYVSLDENGAVSNIVEKKVISSLFCVGGYSFADAKEYLKHYSRLKHLPNLYISHVIFEMLLAKRSFRPVTVTDYSDWGTLDDWDTFKRRFCTLFIDMDGVLVGNSGQFFEPKWGSTRPIRENVSIINKLYDGGMSRIIITTSRTAEARALTLRQLKLAGIKFHDIIFGLFHGQRVIINDYSATNPYKSCDAINIKRNSTDLKEMLEEALTFKIPL